MKITIDLRSALLGLAAGVLLMLTLGAVGNPLPWQVGRFQVSAGDTTGLIVDTATGQVWLAHLNDANLGTDAEFKKPKMP